MDPLVRTYWYSNVTEGLPIWHQPWRVALNLSAGLVAGAISWFLLSARLRGEARRQLLTIGFFVFFGVLLSLLVVRTISVATAFAIPVTASFIAVLFRRLSPSQNSGPQNRPDRCDPCPSGSGSCNILAGQGLAGRRECEHGQGENQGC